MFFNRLNWRSRFILFYILLIAHSSVGEDKANNESSSSLLTSPEITTWESDEKSTCGQFIKSSAIDNTENILVWKSNVEQGYIINYTTVSTHSVYLTFKINKDHDAVCINLDSLTQKGFKVPEEILHHLCEPFIVYDDIKDKILFLAGNQIRIFDQYYLKLENNLSVSSDCRIRPILFEDDLIFVEGNRGQSIVRIDSNGNNVWTCKLPGYVRSNPAVYGSIMILQTRQRSYGGQTTTAIDLTNGKILWSETTNAYGYGVCFNDDAYLCFESDFYLNPQKTEGWLICRMPKTGKQKWKHTQRGALEHIPVFDQKNNNVYAVFSEFVDKTRSGGENELICFEGDTGAIRWRSKLENAVKLPQSLDYEQYWPAIRFQDNMLMVLDEKDVLHFFDPNNGNLLLSLDLNPIIQICSFKIRKPEIINMPIIIKDELLVFTDLGFVLYPIRYGLHPTK